MPSERDPLLTPDNASTKSKSSHKSKTSTYSQKSTPLPYLQLSIVFLIQFVEPLTGTVIFPFINQFIRETGITGGDERKTGYYAGFVESIFFITESLTTFLWARLSDKIGRKPVLLIGVILLTLATAPFGLTNNYFLIMFFRGIQGVCNGNIGVSKAVMAELTDSSNVASVFGAIPLVWTTGTTIAPIIGGLLANPADQWPDTLGKLLLLRNHPYFLPCFIVAIFTALVALYASLCLKETHPRSQRIRTTSPSSDTLIDADVERDTSDEDSEEDSEDTMPLKELLKPPVIITVCSAFALAFLSQSISVLFPLFYSTSIDLGGLGFDAGKIGTMMGAYGLFNGFLQLAMFSWFIRRLGARGLYIMTMSTFAVNPICYIIITTLARRAGGDTPLIWVFIVIQLSVTTLISMAYGSMYIYIIELVPKQGVASMNGLVQTAATVGRALAPSVVSSLYSVTLQTGALSGTLVYVALLAFSVVGAFITAMIPKTKSLVE